MRQRDRDRHDGYAETGTGATDLSMRLSGARSPRSSSASGPDIPAPAGIFRFGTWCPSRCDSGREPHHRPDMSWIPRGYRHGRVPAARLPWPRADRSGPVLRPEQGPVRELRLPAFSRPTISTSTSIPSERRPPTLAAGWRSVVPAASQCSHHELPGRQPLILYATPAQFRQTNVVEGTRRRHGRRHRSAAPADRAAHRRDARPTSITSSATSSPTPSSTT